VIARTLAVVAVLAAGLPFGAAAAQDDTSPVCAPNGDPVELTGSAQPSDAKTYQVHPFRVADGTTRVEVSYEWAPVDGTTFDLGLWDQHGYKDPAGFRGWSGNREGRIDRGMDPVWVQADSAERGFTPGTVRPGTWYVELGVAEVAPGGAAWKVLVTCSDPKVGKEAKPDPVDPNHVANPRPGWYHGDFHMHSWNSNPQAPDYDGFVRYGREAGLDFMPMTEYVVHRHWNELGRVQRANPDVVIWPSREVITYFGHAVVLGETPDAIDYRQGFEDVTLGDIQRKATADGALFGIDHPTTFPEKDFGSTCRGCEFQLADQIDLDLVDTVEVANDHIAYGTVQNPFAQTAIDFWEDLLQHGHKVTAVSGSDDKKGPDLGNMSTAVYAEELSRPALTKAIRAGHAYVQTHGTNASPTLDMTATGDDGSTAMFGDTIVGTTAVVKVTVTGAVGQHLRVLKDGTETTVVPIDASPFEYTFTADRAPDEGPLGTFWRVETFDDVSLTTIGNPIFLADRQPEPKAIPTTTNAPRASSSSAADSVEPGDGIRSPALALGVFAVLFGLLLLGRRWVRRRSDR
jgi:hypothetical protein